MQLIDRNISVEELKIASQKMFDGLVKAVVDIERKIMVVDADMHADEEEFLLEKGSQQNDLWGINIYPALDGEQRIEFDSMINIRPAWGNRSRGVDDPAIREKIIQIVNNFITI